MPVPLFWLFLPLPASLCRMDATFGQRLQAARKRAGYRTQQDLGDVVGRSGKTVRNWETGRAVPDHAMRETLHRLLGEFDQDGDPVESAIRRSELSAHRQYEVLSVYTRNLHEQRAEAAV